MIRSLIDGVLDDDRYNLALYALNKYTVDNTTILSGLTQAKTVTLQKRYITKQLPQWIILAGRGDHGTGKEYEDCVD